MDRDSKLASFELERYLDEAVRFSPRHAGSTRMRSIRAATTLVTNRIAVAVLNRLGVPAEPETSYRLVNVHNPRCPLRFEQETNHWSCTPELADHPAWGINWGGACLISEYMGGRLPSVQEWECMASNNDPAKTYPWGDAPATPSLANFGEYFGGTSRVGLFPPSEIGLYDLAGNLAEWCCDVHEMANGHRASFERAVKGGAWSKDAHHLEVATRRGKWERLGTTTIGFRPVWDD
jgi:formylglycine-generating enzyme required for sulfatase activity